MPLPTDRQNAAPITRLTEHIVYSNRFVTVYDDDVRFSDGRTSTYIRVVQSDGRPGVVTLPIAGEHIALVRVYRYPIGDWEWGLPRGLAHGSDPAETARAELVEELGTAPRRLIPLGCITPDSGTLASFVHLYAAEYSHRPTVPQDTTEVKAVQWVHIDDLRASVRSGDVVDGFTLAALGAAACHGFPSP